MKKHLFSLPEKPRMYKLHESTLEEGAIFQENASLYPWHLRLSSPNLSAMFLSSSFQCLPNCECTATFGFNIQQQKIYYSNPNMSETLLVSNFLWMFAMKFIFVQYFLLFVQMVQASKLGDSYAKGCFPSEVSLPNVLNFFFL